ncbi:MAG TPA: hypothetical protein PLZ08_12965 [Bacillota bacterium]|jgi:hypothetical protein|nr:hypothetical protein [Bacillota bacterium]
MRRIIGRFTIILLLVVCLVSCSSDQVKLDLGKLQRLVSEFEDRFNSMGDLGILSYCIGYDGSGKVVIWLDVEDEYAIYGKYALRSSYIAKYLFDHFPELDSIWIDCRRKIEDSTCSYFTRTDYQSSGLTGIADKYTFFKNDQTNKMIHYSWDYYRYNREYLGLELVEAKLRRLFGSRLKSVEFEIGEGACVELIVEGLPENDGTNQKLSQEIAQALILSVGRHLHDFCTIRYRVAGKNVLEIFMYVGDFNRWLANGLHENDWFRYCRDLDILDKRIKFNGAPVMMRPQKLEITYDSYLKVWNSLSRNNDVEVLLLGVGDKGIGVVLKSKKLASEQLTYKKQMELSQQLMESAVYSVRFFTIEEGAIEMLKLDQDRYKVLMYKNPERRFDFGPEEWSFMGSDYWKYEKK